MADNYSMTVDGVALHAVETYPVVNPATEAVVGHAPMAGPEELDLAIQSAAIAFPKWKALTLEERRRYLHDCADVVDANTDNLALLLTLEQGKPVKEARKELAAAARWLRSISLLSPPEETRTEDGRTIKVRYVPVGVVGAITPWNYPVSLACWKVAPALLMGNTVVLKPSPFTPLTTLRIGELLRGVLPRGVLNVVSGNDDLGRQLAEHNTVSKVSFTGSTATGRRVIETTGKSIKRITLELGGNDAAIVLPDIDVARTVKDVFWAAFTNSGQLCTASKRIYVHERIYDTFRKSFAEYAKSIVVGNGLEPATDLGPIQNERQFRKVKGLIEEAKKQGLSFLAGAQQMEGPGYFVPVTIIDNPPDDSDVVREEAFGPIVPLLPFKDIQEVIERANASDYGLAASVWTNDLDIAENIGMQLEVGTVWINECSIFSPNIVFGGHKHSGLGVENSIEGLLEYTNPHVVFNKA